jgi:hypothetical protein
MFIDYFSNDLMIKSNNNNKIVLFNEEKLELFPFDHVDTILKTLKINCLTNNQHLAIASRALNRDLALKAIDLFGWSNLFSSMQIHPGSKVIHLNDIKFELKFNKFSDVLFFDDNINNIIELKNIGVKAFHVNYEEGLNINTIHDGLKMYDKT